MRSRPALSRANRLKGVNALPVPKRHSYIRPVLTRRVSIGIITVALLALPDSAAQSQRPPELWGHLQRGRYTVGFTVWNPRDMSRPISSGVGRPVQISAWYPATEPRSGVPMRFADYYLLTASQRTLLEPDSAERARAYSGFKAFLVRAGSTAAAAEQWLQSPVLARRNAPRARRRFPIVLIAQGSFESAYSQAVLAEFLASHGFVVATSPAPLLLEPEGTPRKSLLELARTQAADLSSILRQIASLGYGDTTHVGIVAHSFGARSAFLLAASGHIDGLVSLDGGIANQQGRDWLDSAHLDLSKFKTPILHFYQTVDSTVTPDFSLLERLGRSDRTIVKVDSIYHIDFSSVGFARALYPALAVAPPSPSLETKVEQIAELTLNFLTAVTKDGEVQPSKMLLRSDALRSRRLLAGRSLR